MEHKHYTKLKVVITNVLINVQNNITIKHQAMNYYVLQIIVLKYNYTYHQIHQIINVKKVVKIMNYMF